MHRSLRYAAISFGTLLVIGLSLSAQSANQKTADQKKASYEAHKGDFDYLLGDWEFTTVSRDHGTGRGFWSAMRLAEGQILDEFRIVGERGETYYVTTTLRAYNAALDRWELVGMDQGNGLQNVGVGRRVGGEVHIEQKFGVETGKPTILRIRYHDIRPDRFSWTADESADEGKTWTKDVNRIEARRIGPARTMGPLAPAK